MLSAVSRNAPDSGTSLPLYCANAAAMVAARTGASAARAARKTRVSLMRSFSRRLAAKAKRKRQAMKVKDKVCVVTGAAGGIGEAIARRYAKEGAKGVVVADMTRSGSPRSRAISARWQWRA